MVGKRRRTLPQHVASYFKSEIESASNSRRKQALQHIAKLFRNGAIFLEADRIGIENTVLGVLSSAASDEKIRRWALVVLAYVGRRDVSRNAVLHAINDYPNEPQVLAAAIATLFRFDSNEAQTLILRLGICSPEIIALSALQTAPPDKVDFSNIKINIDKADDILLKLALLLVGLDRAPMHLFDPKYSNAEIVKKLGSHHEPIVSQYSVWAAAESPKLGISSIGINIKALDDQPPNVRSYVYRLFAEDKQQSTQRHDVILQGSNDHDNEARIGCAIGLRESYYDGLENVTIDWFHDEREEDISEYLLDHIVAQAGQFPAYKQIALEQYDIALMNPRKRIRMEAAAEGTEIYREFKRISFQGQAGLFGISGGPIMTNNFFNNGVIQGAISQGGDAKNAGEMKALLTAHEIGKANNIFHEVLRDIETLPLDDGLKKDLQQSVSNAQINTNKETIGKVLDVLQNTEKSLTSIDGAIEKAKKIAGYISILSTLV